MRNAYQNAELIRESKGITQKKVAETAKISTMVCSNLLSGKTKLPADLLPYFAKALGIADINIFFDDKLTDSVIKENET